MISVNENSCKIEGMAINLMTELTIIMRRLRDLNSDTFDDECFKACVELSAKSDEELHKEASAAVERLLNSLFTE